MESYSSGVDRRISEALGLSNVSLYVCLALSDGSVSSLGELLGSRCACEGRSLGLCIVQN